MKYISSKLHKSKFKASIQSEVWKVRTQSNMIDCLETIVEHQSTLWFVYSFETYITLSQINSQPQYQTSCCETEHLPVSELVCDVRLAGLWLKHWYWWIGGILCTSGWQYWQYTRTAVVPVSSGTLTLARCVVCRNMERPVLVASHLHITASDSYQLGWDAVHYFLAKIQYKKL